MYPPPRYPSPVDEPQRLASLRSYGVLDTPPDPRFDAITQLAARLFDVPVVLVSLIDEDRQWFKSAVGPIPAGSQTDRCIAFCNHALLAPGQVMVVGDATADPRFAQHPSVTGPSGVRFYAGAPIIGLEGHALGTLCLVDVRPRQFSPADCQTLSDLALAVTSALDLHRSLRDLQDSEQHYRHAVELSPHIPWSASADGVTLAIGPRWFEITGLTREQALGDGWMQAVHPEDLPRVEEQWRQVVRTGEPIDIEYRFRTRDGGYRWVRDYGAAHKDPAGRVLRWYGSIEDIHERKLSQAHVEHMAYHDSLTGLPNRRQFRARLKQEIAGADEGALFALLSLDLDNFKAVNDTCGHLHGDALLQHIAKRLSASIRGQDLVARTGGDEFLIVVPELQQPDEAALLAERIQMALSEPIRLDGHSIAVSASIGIAIHPRDAADPDMLLQCADLALYRAKSRGRRTFRFFVPEMDEKLRRQHELKVDLRAALERGELSLVYQPLVGLRTGQVEGFEALLRWTHPRRGIVSPTEFVPAAETSGLILPIGRLALERACSDAMRWPEQIRVAVNLSSVQFGQHDLPEMVRDALSLSGLPADRLELEITESVPLLDDAGNVETLHRLREMGVRVVLDDFGTGYASLGYLQSFPFSKLKIDRSFVSRVTEEKDARTLVRTILAMARALKVGVTAEGVETKEQLEFLRTYGCDQVQGYLLGQPVPAADVPAAIGALGAQKSPGRGAGPHAKLTWGARLRTVSRRWSSLFPLNRPIRQGARELSPAGPTGMRDTKELLASWGELGQDDRAVALHLIQALKATPAPASPHFPEHS
ncbi:putative bifunctional diguanylate cyclase/phosphodiesterase [Rhizosaccharibacter radicis]|uniref:EAL domain-containing protein n=1 Tax=Rhizosaccharibacter radicis TaxID=2782605 RepID=A0ABT1VY56_9PROT|nr:EAL domain-containing protein [Acetobacteraceae bacterium KSS12]